MSFNTKNGVNDRRHRDYSEPEQNLKQLYESQKKAVMWSHERSDYTAVRNLCAGALSSSRLPSEYELFYRRLLKHLDDAEANPAAERKEAANTEDLAEAMLHALTVTNGTEEDDQEEKEETVRDLEAIIGEAKDIGGMAAEQKRAENEALFVTLMDLSGAATYDEVANACKHARHSSNP